MNYDDDDLEIKTFIEADDVKPDWNKPGRFRAFCSDLGWPEGQYPALLTTDLGNGYSLALQRQNCILAQYKQWGSTMELTVFNH